MAQFYFMENFEVEKYGKYGVLLVDYLVNTHNRVKESIINLLI